MRKLHGAKITLCTVYIKIAREDNDLSVWKKEKGEKDSDKSERERDPPVGQSFPS